MTNQQEGLVANPVTFGTEAYSDWVADIDELIKDALYGGEDLDPDDLPEGVVLVDCFMMTWAFGEENLTEDLLARFKSVVNRYPTEAFGHPMDPLSKGPSYIGIGAAVSDQTRALAFMGLGQALDQWTVITPTTLGLDRSDQKARQMAGLGFVMIAPRST